MAWTDLFRPKWKDRDWRKREAAVKELTHQATLAGIAKRDVTLQVRIAAVERLNDQAVLTDIATNDRDPPVRLAARSRLVNMREGAVEKLAVG